MSSFRDNEIHFENQVQDIVQQAQRKTPIAPAAKDVAVAPATPPPALVPVGGLIVARPPANAELAPEPVGGGAPGGSFTRLPSTKEMVDRVMAENAWG